MRNAFKEIHLLHLPDKYPTIKLELIVKKQLSLHK